MNISIKNAPDALVEKLKARAARNHRSLQGELLTILEEAVELPSRRDALDILREIRELGISTPATSVEMIRQYRDR
jgi:plasmid stability protein